MTIIAVTISTYFSYFVVLDHSLINNYRYLIAAGFAAGIIVGGFTGAYFTKQSFSRVPRIVNEVDVDNCLNKIKEIENSLLTDTQEYKDAYNNLYQSHQKLSDGM